MSLQLTNTQAGDDSDGKVWGHIEGTNIFIVLGGATLTAAAILALTKHHYSLPLAITLGSIPFVLSLFYVLCLRQGKPKSYDSDLLDTLINGTGWQPDLLTQRPNPITHNEISERLVYK